TIPPPHGQSGPSTPTGTVAIGSGLYTAFIFSTEDGTISSWTSANGNTAVLRVDHSGSAVYKGLGVASRNGALTYYAPNFFAGTVEAYDSGFNAVSLPPGAFTDSQLPLGYAPFNVTNVAGKLVVCFAKQDVSLHDEVDGAGLGFVD